jgi:hypothetical protein
MEASPMSHPAHTHHNRHILAAARSFRARALNLARSLFPVPPNNAIAASVLAVAVVFFTGCAAGSFELQRPDGVAVKVSAVSFLRDTGLEGFSYTVDEKSRGGGLLPATESRAASVGAKGYTGTTKAETLIKLLEALP